MNAATGAVYLVGAGPGDPGLMTVRGQALLETADVVVHDRLIGPELLAFVRDGAEIIDVGKRPGDPEPSQERIERILIDRARRGFRVIRLKGGDPFVFGRGFEEFAACRDAGVPCIVVPGVTSAIAGPAAAGIPVTLRRVARSFAVVTAGMAPGAADVDFTTFRGVDTLVILMGRARLAEVANALTAAGRDVSTPAACIERATTSCQRVVRGTLGTIAEAAEREQLSAPLVTVVGEVAALAHEGSFGAGGLAGKRVLVTKSGSSCGDVTRSLRAAGAAPIGLPLIEIRYCTPALGLRDILAGPAGAQCAAAGVAYEWIIFTSIHGVRGFWRALRAADLDTRALGMCKVAAVGPATASALQKRGITPDLVPSSQTGTGLTRAMFESSVASGTRILFPKGDIGGADIAEGLRGGGVEVDEMVVYSTVDATPSQASLAEAERGVDAILFFSPSAVRRFSALGLHAGDAVIACIGPTTAEAAADRGMIVDVVPPASSGEALVIALDEFFQLASLAT